MELRAKLITSRLVYLISFNSHSCLDFILNHCFHCRLKAVIHRLFFSMQKGFKFALCILNSHHRVFFCGQNR